MKISLKGLSRFIDIPFGVNEISEALTQCGLEVEQIINYESVKGSLSGIITGEVISCIPHPDADRLKLTTVNVGSVIPLQIVCGAPNVEEGQKVAVAVIGTVLYSGDKEWVIKEAKIRGQLSQGMICAEDEIGLSNNHDGILILNHDTPVGKPLAEIIPIYTDTIFEIGLTPNRGDAASHLGVARDLAAIFKLPLKDYIHPSSTDENLNRIKIAVYNTQSCTSYHTIRLNNLNIQSSSPEIIHFLNSVGIKTINNLVDSCNYIMVMYGHPMHIFDAEKLNGNIQVRNAQPGEKIILLDKKEYILSKDDLVIADNNNPIALAGIMGGLDSAVSEKTTSVWIESAVFNAASIRKSARRHALNTDASFRFERGSDPIEAKNSMLRWVNYLNDICPPSLMVELADSENEIPSENIIACKFQYMDDLLGYAIDREEIKSILSYLGFEFISFNESSFEVKVPLYKYDVTRPADVVEEVLRIYGLNRIPLPKKMSISINSDVQDLYDNHRRELITYLNGCGLNEIITNSLVSSETEGNPDYGIKLLNPLSNNMNQMRTTLLHSMFQVLEFNLNRQKNNLALVETGKIYRKNSDGNFYENKRLAMMFYGNNGEENYESKPVPFGLGYVKSIISDVFKKSGVNNYTEIYNELIPGLFEPILFKTADTQLGYMGLYGVSGYTQPVYYVELDMDALGKIKINHKPLFKGIPKFPFVRRDLALLMDENIMYHTIETAIFKLKNKFINKINLFDVYRGKQLEQGKKSYAISITLSADDHTLTESEIDNAMKNITSKLLEIPGIQLR